AHTSKWGVGGCLFGIGAAVLTGGAAAPLALGGCAGGLAMGSMSEDECGAAPSCAMEEAQPLAPALARPELASIPACGGYAGFAVVPYNGPLAAPLFVREVGPAAGTTARSAGLQPNDLVFRVNGAAVSNKEMLDALLATLRPGAPTTFDVM